VKARERALETAACERDLGALLDEAGHLMPGGGPNAWCAESRGEGVQNP
jgi:hypothetical protein